MFGISPLGWIHTLGSLPAIPLAAYMLIRHGRIRPWTRAGLLYFVSMLIGAVTVFLVAHQSVSYGIAAVTILLLLGGYGVGSLPISRSVTVYVETVLLSMTVFLLMLPTASETLRRVPDGHPLVTDLKSPLLLGVQGGLLLAFVVGTGAQVAFLRRRANMRQS